MNHSHVFYIGWSYGVTAVALLVEIVALRMRRAQSLRRIEEERDLEAQD